MSRHAWRGWVGDHIFVGEYHSVEHHYNWCPDRTEAHTHIECGVRFAHSRRYEQALVHTAPTVGLFLLLLFVVGPASAGKPPLCFSQHVISRRTSRWCLACLSSQSRTHIHGGLGSSALVRPGSHAFCPPFVSLGLAVQMPCAYCNLICLGMVGTVAFPAFLLIAVPLLLLSTPVDFLLPALCAFALRILRACNAAQGCGFVPVVLPAPSLPIQLRLASMSLSCTCWS